MKLRKIAVIISAVALALTLTGCGNDPVDNLFNNLQNGQSGGSILNPFESKPTVQLPDIPVNDASAFEYKFDSEYGGMAITGYKLQSPKIHIPNKLEGEPVVKVDFSGVSKDITHIIMPDSVQEFGFSDQIKKTLEFVNVPDSVTEIGESAFEGCNENIQAIYKGQTYDNSNVKFLFLEVLCDENGLCIKDDELRYCSIWVTNVTIPDSVTEIGDYAFYFCESLTSIDVADGNPEYCSRDGMLCQEGEHGGIYLYTCPKGRSGRIVIPDDVTEIGRTAFSGCTGLTSIDVANGNPHFCSIDGMLCVKEKDGGITLYRCPQGKSGSIVIPDSVTVIYSHAFYNCTGLSSVTIPDSVTEIAGWLYPSFKDCENIKVTYKGKTYDYEHIEDLYNAINSEYQW